MKKFYLLLLLFVLFASINASARKRTFNEMEQAASSAFASHLKHQRLALPIDAQVKVVHETEQMSILADVEQYAVIANDDRFDAVLAYIDSPYSEDAMANPGFRWWFNAMNESLACYLSFGTYPYKVRVSSNYKESVEPFVTTKWDQETPYNNMTPSYTAKGVEKHFVTGCVATAMAQTMNYYKYPPTGKGAISYRSKGYADTGEEITKLITVNFAKGDYDWTNMLDEYKNKNYTTEQVDAVAKLMFHCGVSIKMMYDKGGSGAYTHDAASAYIDRFMYNENMMLYDRSFFHVNEYMDILYAHLSQFHPILYSGSSSSGGHAFVLDGYDASGKVHVNWGWGGSQDGYFNIVTLNGFSSTQDMVPVVLPNEPLEERHSLFGLFENPEFTLIGTLSAKFYEVYNIDFRTFDGCVALIAQCLEDRTKTALGLDEVASVYHYNGFSEISWDNIDISTLKDGTYRLYLATRGKDETEWFPVRSSENVRNSAILTISEGKSSLSVERSSDWVVKVNDVLQNNKKVDGIYSLQGQKMNENQRLKKGIYIKNGRKVLIK